MVIRPFLEVVWDGASLGSAFGVLARMNERLT